VLLATMSAVERITDLGRTSRLVANVPRRHQSGMSAGLRGPHFPYSIRADALIGQERTSKIMLNGVSVARRKRLKPASVAT
jgi:hypothetical protein